MAYLRGGNNPNRNSQRKYYLARVDLKKYNAIIDGRNFYGNPIENDIEKYRELKKVMIEKGEDYSTGSLLDYNYFNKLCKSIAVDLSKKRFIYKKNYMQIQEQFNKLNLSICLKVIIIIQLFIGYLKNLKKLY